MARVSGQRVERQELRAKGGGFSLNYAVAVCFPGHRIQKPLFGFKEDDQRRERASGSVFRFPCTAFISQVLRFPGHEWPFEGSKQ